ncbi:glycosyltransferase [Lentimicrobium sp. L6]|uniref:glycosyltransferase family A protein n=1 Tax=Lentimicrobium sp. L6 TaxID=2735916 RepID=UPI0015517C98|nr:glycosyltransferase family A protein [Lentimicrobium sp. L6]NPD84432.1 glycosyltransferase [Lentimicrobium sp. L6]
MSPILYICLPVLNEYENLPDLLKSFRLQSYQNFKLIVCVNQADEWWKHDEKLEICHDNANSIKFLEESSDLDIHIIDRSSIGKGWIGKKKGVGWARKLSMDYASELGEKKDIILSVDADTYYPPDYFESIISIFSNDKSFSAHSNPYFHRLTGKQEEDSAILRYELYMRVYAINMLLISNPYAFSAIGSGMASSIENYTKIGGISPKASGEDFYFLQHMRKMAPLHQYNEVKVYPQARFSDRVNFGTGPAMIKGNSGDWSSYPFYPPPLFQQIKQSYNVFSKLFLKDIDFPMSEFLKKQLKKEDLWSPLRKNNKKEEKFIRACEELVDGLRILQYLKEKHTSYSKGDLEDLRLNLKWFAENDEEFASFYLDFSNTDTPLNKENMIILREELTKLEYKYRRIQSLS